MRVLGIDPGSRFTGYGVVEQRGRFLSHVGHGVIRLDPGAALDERLYVLFQELALAVDAYRPDAVAVEGVFTFKNARSALVLGHARGVALLVAAQRTLPVHEYPPARVKKSVGASGSGDKDAVARMVRTFLSLEEVERSDASDALAVAICHLNHAARAAIAPTARSRRARRTAGGTKAFAELLRPAYQPPPRTSAGAARR